MAERFSLKDHLFNPRTVSQLGNEYAAALPRFDPVRFEKEALGGFETRELMQRLEWLADCVERQLDGEFVGMAEQLEAAMPDPLDPNKTDDDFGQFIHAVPGILAVRRGLENHRDRAIALLYKATQRFSMEFYIRPFLIRWPNETLEALDHWTDDPNYHVRRLVSEGTRPKLPWAKSVSLTPQQTLPLLEKLHGDRTRYVTRSVCNHLNDLAKQDPDLVLGALQNWQDQKKQSQKELAWMKAHALRTLVKNGHGGAMSILGFRAHAPVYAEISIDTHSVAIGDALAFQCRVEAETETPILVDYRISFPRQDGSMGEKVFKLRQGKTGPTRPFEVVKVHKFKADATTFTWCPGQCRLVLQVNGVDRAEAAFELTRQKD